MSLTDSSHKMWLTDKKCCCPHCWRQLGGNVMFAAPTGGARYIHTACEEKYTAEEIVINVRIADRSKWTFLVNWPSVRGINESEVSRKCRNCHHCDQHRLMTPNCSSVVFSKRFWGMRVTPWKSGIIPNTQVWWPGPLSLGYDVPAVAKKPHKKVIRIKTTS